VGDIPFDGKTAKQNKLSPWENLQQQIQRFPASTETEQLNSIRGYGIHGNITHTTVSNASIWLPSDSA